VFSKKDENINSKFYLSLFQFGYTNKVFYGFGQGSSMLGRWRLPSSEFNNFKLPYPSLEEQNQIVEYLDNQFNRIDETIIIEEKKIASLKEYRQALISEVVTGKIKVVED
jgi:type I restriction enzyme S subunit